MEESEDCAAARTVRRARAAAQGGPGGGRTCIRRTAAARPAYGLGSIRVPKYNDNGPREQRRHRRRCSRPAAF